MMFAKVLFWCLCFRLMHAQQIPREESAAASFFVSDLPDFDASSGPLPIMHAGQIPIDDGRHKGKLFFWHVQAETQQETRGKTIIWLNGGPGCSSMDGMMMETGPFRVHDQNKVTVNNGSWSQSSNLLFIDQPLGVGFSTKETDALHELDEVGEDLLLFMDKYFEIFPHERLNDLYITGESYAGQYIPYFAKAILDRNKLLESQSDSRYLRLGGLAIGNGWIDPIQQYLAYVPFSRDHDMLPPGSKLNSEMETLHGICAKKLSDLDFNVTVHVDECEALVVRMLAGNSDDHSTCFNMYDIRLTDSFPSCGMNWPPDLNNVAQYLGRPDVVSALHVDRKGPWVECSGEVGSSMKALHSKPSVDILPAILAEVPVLLFSGDMDFICNSYGTEAMIDHLYWNDAQGWLDSKSNTKNFTLQDGSKLLGSVITERNLTYTKIFGASHMVPVDDPIASLEMIENFIFQRDWAPEPMNSTIPDSRAKEKLIEDATWHAYYKAGIVALIVILHLLGLLFFFVFFRKRHSGVRFADDADPTFSTILKSFFLGLTRWKPQSLLNRKKGFRNLEETEEEELAEFEISDDYSDSSTASVDDDNR